MKSRVDSIEFATSQGTFSADAAGPSDSPLVLLLHGFPQSRYTWRDVVPAVVAGGCRAFAPDQRGYSPGVRPVPVEAYATDRLVADVIDFADGLGARRTHLVGHDWGGQVAWMTAARHPDRVASLCVLSRPHPAAFARAFDVDADQAGRSGHHRRFLDLQMTDTLWRDNCAGLRAALERGGVAESAVNAYLSVMSDRSAVDAALNWYRAAATDGLRAADCPDVSVPTLYLWGDQDSTVGRAAAELTAEHVRGPYRFVEVSGSGHFLTDDGGAPVVIEELLAHIARSPL